MYLWRWNLGSSVYYCFPDWLKCQVNFVACVILGSWTRVLFSFSHESNCILSVIQSCFITLWQSIGNYPWVLTHRVIVFRGFCYTAVRVKSWRCDSLAFGKAVRGSDPISLSSYVHTWKHRCSVASCMRYGEIHVLRIFFGILFGAPPFSAWLPKCLWPFVLNNFSRRFCFRTVDVFGRARLFSAAHTCKRPTNVSGQTLIWTLESPSQHGNVNVCVSD